MSDPRSDRAKRREGQCQPSPLSEGVCGAEGVVAALGTSDARDLNKLLAIGILPGVTIRLVRRFPSFVFQVGYTQFTVDRQLAQKIIVQWRDY